MGRDEDASSAPRPLKRPRVKLASGEDPQAVDECKASNGTELSAPSSSPSDTEIPRRATGSAAGASLPPNAVPGRECPYMHTINRAVLDFDFEKVCSVSLEAHNVYACLICGKFFQGRAQTSHAFAHALDADHHIFLNLHTEHAYCLPDNYRVCDPLIDSIAFALRPKFSADEVAQLDVKPHRYRTLDGANHLQGVTALDNLHASDYANVVFQLLLAVSPIRDYLLLAPHDASTAATALMRAAAPSTRLLAELSALAQKLWSPAAFRAHVSPHEVMQEVQAASKGRFSPLVQSDPVDFFAWLVHTLHREVGRAVSADAGAGMSHLLRRNKLLVKECFEGSLEITTYSDGGVSSAVTPGAMQTSSEEVKTTRSSPFWFLSLDLPPKPLFKDASERTLVAQVQLWDLLKKYDGVSQHHVVKTGSRMSYNLTRLPPFLVLTVKRMTKTKFATEKNPAVVHCPVQDLDLFPLCKGPASLQSEETTYALVAVVIHDGPHDSGSYRVAFRHAATATWYNIHNMSITEVLPQVVSLSETCMLLYEKQKGPRS